MALRNVSDRTLSNSPTRATGSPAASKARAASSLPGVSVGPSRRGFGAKNPATPRAR